MFRNTLKKELQKWEQPERHPALSTPSDARELRNFFVFPPLKSQTKMNRRIHQSVVWAKLNAPSDQMEIYGSYESQLVSAGEYDDKIGELYSFQLLKLFMSLVADHVVHSGVNTDQAKTLYPWISTCQHTTAFAFIKHELDRNRKPVQKVIKVVETTAVANMPTEISRWTPDGTMIGDNTSNSVGEGTAAMSHPSIQSETSRPVSDAALCMFALLTPVASAPAFVFSPNICQVCDCPHGRFEIKAKKTWEELFYWDSGLSWHRSMFTLALKIHLQNKALTSLFMRQQKKKNTLMMYKMPYQSYSKVCHWCFIHLPIYSFIYLFCALQRMLFISTEWSLRAAVP